MKKILPTFSKTLSNTITVLATLILLSLSSSSYAIMASAQCLETTEALQDVLILHQDGVSKQRTLDAGNLFGHNLSIWYKVTNEVYSSNIPVLGGYEGQRLIQAIVNEASMECMGNLMEFMFQVQ